MQQEPYYDDEIDLREIIQTLISGWKVILTLSLVAAVAAFGISKWVLPEVFQAASYVIITEPMVQFAEASEITINTNLPDINSVTELATGQALLEKVTTTPKIAVLWDAEKDSIKEMVEVTGVGNDRLRLQVSDTSPERAALLANIWAEEVAKQINLLYGVDAIAQTLEAQVIHAREDYAQAQAALEEAYSQSNLDNLEAQLGNTKSDLSCLLARQSAATRILEDLQVLEESIQTQTTGNSLSLGDALSLTTLQQRASASQICASETQSPQLQIGNDALIGIPLSDTFKTISQMRVALQMQGSFLKGEQARLEAEIPSLQRDLAEAAYQLDQRRQARDQAQELFTALEQQQGRITTILNTSGKVATVSAPAVIPDEKSSPKTMINSVLAGSLGLMLGIFWVFAAGWWQNNEADKLDQKDK